MTWPVTWVGLALAGGIGAVLRHRVSIALTDHPSGGLVATAIVNLAGALLLGVVVAAGSATTVAVLGTGLLGGLTTFSTWLVQGVAAAPLSRRLLVVGGQLVAGVALASLGLALGGRL